MAAIVGLLDEVCQTAGQTAFSAWIDWLDTIAPWLATVGQVGDLRATHLAGLPPAVAMAYGRVEAKYEAIARRYPAAARVMSENFTEIFTLIKTLYPALNLQDIVTQREASPDVLGHAFLASLGWPPAWGRFFPPWGACVEQAGYLIPADASQQIYQALADGHVRAAIELRQPIPQPRPGGDPDEWALWLATVIPYSSLPLRVDTEITAVPLIPALAGQFSRWVTREMPLVQFDASRLAGEPVLFKIASITTMLLGLNGFFQQKTIADLGALAELDQALLQAANAAAVSGGLPPGEPDPAEVYQRVIAAANSRGNQR